MPEHELQGRALAEARERVARGLLELAIAELLAEWRDTEGC
jgi:hypothetical protein